MPWWILQCPDDTPALWEWAAAMSGGDCPLTLETQISWVVGMLSIMIWTVALTPQIYHNWKRKAVGNVSVWGWFVWLLGDIFNLIGALLTVPVVPSEIGNALVYLVATGVVLAQCIYYKYIMMSPEQVVINTMQSLKVTDGSETVDKEDAQTANRSPSSSTNEGKYSSLNGASSNSTSEEIDDPDDVARVCYLGYQHTKPISPENVKTRKDSSLSGVAAVDRKTSQASLLGGAEEAGKRVNYNSCGSTRSKNSALQTAVYVVAILSIMSTTNAAHPFRSTDHSYNHRYNHYKHYHWSHKKYMHRDYVGDQSDKQPWFVVLIAWAMTFCYTLFRIPQIQLMCIGRVDGLSMCMFFLTFFGNFTFLVSILTRNPSWDYLRDQMPWVTDAIVCMTLDVIILVLFQRQNRDDELIAEKAARTKDIESQFA